MRGILEIAALVENSWRVVCGVFGFVFGVFFNLSLPRLFPLQKKKKKKGVCLFAFSSFFVLPFFPATKSGKLCLFPEVPLSNKQTKPKTTTTKPFPTQPSNCVNFDKMYLVSFPTLGRTESCLFLGCFPVAFQVMLPATALGKTYLWGLVGREMWKGRGIAL